MVLAAALAACAFAPTVARAQSAWTAEAGAEEAAADPELSQVRARIESETARSTRAETDIAALGRRRGEASARLRARARALYRLTRAGMLPIAGGFDAVLTHLSRVDRLRRMVKHDADEVRALQVRGDSLRAEMAQAAETLASARAELRALESRRAQRAVASWATPIFAPMSTDSSATQEAALGYGMLRVVGESEQGGGFAALRGALGVPVAGALQISPAASGDGGLELGVTPGAAVRAAAAGRVAFAGAQPGYGRLVIVDHGDNHYTVYGGLDAVEARVGDAVDRGARLGTTSASPLRFEVRRGTRTLDARSWLGF
jgi:septal ring factor EnvC (AmiA/AmiB activator)